MNASSLITVFFSWYTYTHVHVYIINKYYYIFLVKKSYYLRYVHKKYNFLQLLLNLYIWNKMRMKMCKSVINFSIASDFVYNNLFHLISYDLSTFFGFYFISQFYAHIRMYILAHILSIKPHAATAPFHVSLRRFLCLSFASLIYVSLCLPRLVCSRTFLTQPRRRAQRVRWRIPARPSPRSAKLTRHYRRLPRIPSWICMRWLTSATKPMNAPEVPSAFFSQIFFSPLSQYISIRALEIALLTDWLLAV